jgi:hypothetical protein
MGERLEQVYRFDGMTTWSIETYHIEKMDVQSVRPVERDTKKLFLALKESTGNAFEGVSVVEQLKALRGEP